MRLDLWVALRFIREGRAQSALILAGVGVGVGVMVFLSALITGLQASLIKQTLGTQAHVVVRPPEEEARQLRANRGNVAIAARVERPAQRVRSIEGWQLVVRDLATIPGVTAVSPTVGGSAFAIRGEASKSVALLGVDPARWSGIIPIRDKLREGRFDVTGTEALIGIELADDLGVSVGDKIRLAASGDRSDIFTIAGIFDLGNREVNRRWVVVSMRAAQTLLDLVGGVSSIDVRVTDIFAADATADAIQARTGLIAESWMKTNSQLLVGLRSQSSSSVMIQVFVILAVMMGIASVLVVSVVQKSKEIGILRAMGTPRKAVQRVFLIQGALVGLVGSIAGCALGAVLALFFATLAQNPDGSATFPVDLNLGLFARSLLIATLTGLVAAVIPARRASRLDPAEAIRHD